MIADRNSDTTGIILRSLLLQSGDWVDVGNIPILQKTQLLKFYWLFAKVYGGKRTFRRFQAVVMKFYTMIMKAISEHKIMIILHFQ